MNDEEMLRMKNNRIPGTYNSGEMSMFCNGYDENDSLKDGNSSDTSGSLDAPLDFSMKRKSIDSESDSHSMVSPASSINQDVPRSNETRSDLYNGYSVSQNGEKFERSQSYQSNSPSPTSRSPVNMARHIPGYPGVIPNSQLSGHFDTSLNAVDNKKFSQPNGTNKSSRPFKAYPKELLNMPIGYYGGVAPGYMPPHMDGNILQAINTNTEELMKMYKNQIEKIRDIEQQKTICSTPSPLVNTSISSVHSSPPHSPAPTSTTNLNDIRNSVSIMSPGTRKRAKSLPDEQKDEAYWERRRKNNEAAKRSRDARRAKEDEIAIRAALLEQENLKLRVEVAALKNETAKLRCLLYQS